MDGSPSLVRGHVRTIGNEGLMQVALAFASSLVYFVIPRESLVGNLLFIYEVFKSPLVIIREQVLYLKKSEVLKGSMAMH